MAQIYLYVVCVFSVVVVHAATTTTTTITTTTTTTSSSSSFCIHSSADHSTYENKLWRLQLFCSWSLCVEQSAEGLAVIGHVVRNI